MTTIRIKASMPYDVIIGSGVSKGVPDFIRTSLDGVNKIAIVTDSTVDRLYANEVMSNLSAAGFSVDKFVFPAGEASKNLGTYASLIDFLANKHL